MYLSGRQMVSDFEILCGVPVNEAAAFTGAKWANRLQAATCKSGIIAGRLAKPAAPWSKFSVSPPCRDRLVNRRPRQRRR